MTVTDQKLVLERAEVPSVVKIWKESMIQGPKKLASASVLAVLRNEEKMCTVILYCLDHS